MVVDKTTMIAGKIAPSRRPGMGRARNKPLDHVAAGPAVRVRDVCPWGIRRMPAHVLMTRLIGPGLTMVILARRRVPPVLLMAEPISVSPARQTLPAKPQN